MVVLVVASVAIIVLVFERAVTLDATIVSGGDLGRGLPAAPTRRVSCLDRARRAGRRLMARPSERIEPALHSRLAVLRAERGLSRQDLADAVVVNYQTIGYLERNEYNPSLDLALRAAEYFGLPVEAIFSRRPFTPMSEQLYPGAAKPPAGGREESAI